MEMQNSTQILQSLYDAINKHDFDRAVSCFHYNGEFKMVAFDKCARGTSELKEMFHAWIKAFPDMKLEVQNLKGTSDWAMGELFMTGTHKGPFMTPGGEIPATNQCFKTPACDIVNVRDGKIVSLHCYLESGTLMRQLGLAPMKAAA
jgi:steroid delta-isomerase-like uncharacterized protein